MTRRDRDDAEDRPRRYKPRYDDDHHDRRRPPPRAKRRTPVLPFVILGVMLFLVCGVGGFVYTVAVEPRLVAQRRAAQPPPVQMLPRPVDPKLNALRVRMTRAEVEAVLGPLRPAELDDLNFVMDVVRISNEARKAWWERFHSGRVYAWRAGRDCALVEFDADPAAGGKLTAVMASMDSTGFHDEVPMFETVK